MESTQLLESTVIITENCSIFLPEVQSKQDTPKVVSEPSLESKISNKPIKKNKNKYYIKKEIYENYCMHQTGEDCDLCAKIKRFEKLHEVTNQPEF